LVLATNKNLNKAVSENLFREDLFYRLSIIQIEVPPLREKRRYLVISKSNNRKLLQKR
ncbi:MAG TPA: sigma-54-dependent Fis family transcriptional regulator, partial [Ignavibacteria bacterium]|nr:sigma-54-dependent Fis family transcriptional regulator [Ignavibacteria bacterium]